MTFLRDNALFVAAGWFAFGFLVALWFSRMAAHGEREVPVVYDVERDVDPGDGYMGSEAHNSGHGAHFDRWGN